MRPFDMSFLQRFRQLRPQRASLGQALVVSFVLPLTVSIGLIEYLGWKNEQRAIEQLVAQLHQQAGDRIEARIEQLTSTPRKATQRAANALRRGDLDVDDLRGWEAYLSDQGSYFDSLTFFYFGNQSGDYTELYQQANRPDRIVFRDGERPEEVIRTTLESEDSPATGPAARGPSTIQQLTLPFDPRERPWYEAAVRAREATWTKLYDFFLLSGRVQRFGSRAKALGISFVRPYYDETGSLLGVLGADFTLTDINSFLQSLEISPSGEAFILDREGQLIASSFIESPFNSRNQPLHVDETRNELISKTGDFLLERFGDFENITQAYSLDYKDSRERQMLQVRPFSDEFGLDWLVVVVVPESDFTGAIRENSRMTWLLSIAILGGTVLLVSWIAGCLSRAILSLSQASQRIAQGNLSQQIPTSRIRELNTVATAFNRMSCDLQQSYAQLEDYSRSLENRVRQRTQALEKEMSDRARSEQQLSTLVANIPGTVYRCQYDYDWTMEFMSESILELSGYPASDFIHNRVRTFESIMQDEKGLLNALVDEAIKACEPYVLEYCIVHANGSVRHVYDKGRAIFGDNNELLYLDGVFFDVTPMKAAENALKRSEQRYYSLFEDSPMPLWEEDFSLVKAYLLSMKVLPNGGAPKGRDFRAYFDANPDILHECIQRVRVLDVNQAALDLFEAEQKEDLLARLDSDDSTAALEGFKQELVMLCEGQNRLELELVNYTLTGKKKHILFKEFVAPGHEQNWNRVLISMLDISDRKRAEAALQQQSDIDNLLSQISCAFLERKIDTAIEFALKKLGEFTGSDRARIFQFQKRSSGQDQFYLTHMWRQSEVVPYLAERRCIDASTYGWFYHKLLAGDPFQIADIAELPPEAADSQAVFAEHNIRSLLDVPMVYCDQSVGFIALDTTERVRTWSPSEVNVVKLIGEMVAMAQAKHVVEQALVQAKEDAEIANRAKSDFLANMSHELRSPLNAILGFANVMKRSRLLPEEHQDDVQIISRSGEYLLSQINDVLDMSKIESGRIALVPTAFNLPNLLDDLINMFKLRADEKQLQLLLEQDPDLPNHIRVDQAKLRQILINLLNNAIKFTPAGSVTLRAMQTQGSLSPVSTGTAPPLSLSFSVIDTGVGISPEEFETIFEPFGQAQAGREAKEGTGLGMSICRKFVELMGGYLSISSQTAPAPAGQTVGDAVPIERVSELENGQLENGQLENGRDVFQPGSSDITIRALSTSGTTVSFDIQAELAVADSAAGVKPERRVLGLAMGQPEYKILIVDDKLDNRKLLRRLLEPLGFILKEASHGQAAIAMHQAWQPHLILMDVRMPVLDGLEATRRIKQAGQLLETSTASVPKIVALSANSLATERKDAIAAGCDDFIRKPFTDSEIFASIGEQLGVRYRYDEPVILDESSQASSTPEPLATPLNLTAVSALPADLLSRLEAATLRLQWDDILQLIDVIREQDASLANSLHQVVHDFQYGQILESIQTVKAVQQ
ncbi:MAG: response regulator [Cyanobacteria bacterium J06623_4]